MELWIARDKDGELYLFTDKPYLSKGAYFLGEVGATSMRLDATCFPEITLGNSPKKVELKLVEEIVGVAESPSKTFPRVNEFEVGASYRR